MTHHSVFIVDDDPAMRDALLTLMRGAGLRARAFADGQDFLDHLPEDTTACVLTDVRMPGMDGLELMARLRVLDPDLPVILLTGHGDVPMAVQALKDGAWDFLTKPVGVDDLISTLRRATAARAPEIDIGGATLTLPSGAFLQATPWQQPPRSSPSTSPGRPGVPRWTCEKMQSAR